MNKNAYNQINEAIDKYCDMWREEGKKKIQEIEKLENKYNKK